MTINRYNYLELTRSPRVIFQVRSESVKFGFFFRTLTTIPSFCTARCIVLELTLQKEATAGIDWKLTDVTSLPSTVKNSAISGLVTIQL